MYVVQIKNMRRTNKRADFSKEKEFTNIDPGCNEQYMSFASEDVRRSNTGLKVFVESCQVSTAVTVGSQTHDGFDVGCDVYLSPSQRIRLKIRP